MALLKDNKVQELAVPMTSLVERGGTMPLLGRTQYFLGLVVLTWEARQFAETRHCIQTGWKSCAIAGLWRTETW
jgi:hypothetical protein